MNFKKDRVILLTTPLYYCNGSPHLGHAITTVIADVYKRYREKEGNLKVFFVVGTDEHGQKIIESSKKNKVSVEKFVDTKSQSFRNLWKILGIKWDKFVRTSSTSHCLLVKEIMKSMIRKGEVYLGRYFGYYCSQCEDYSNKNLDEIIEEKLSVKICSGCGNKMNILDDESFFLSIKQEIVNYLDEVYGKNIISVIPESRRNFLKSYLNIRESIGDLSISRSNLNWGIKFVDSLPSHTVYVWIDALLGYFSASADFFHVDSPHIDNLKRKWNDEFVEIVQVVGKEILNFHVFHWPIILKFLGARLPDKIVSHGWLKFRDKKMSKSFKNVVNVEKIIEEYGVDLLRYWIVKKFNLTKDIDFDCSSFLDVYNSDLANNLGNLVSRIMKMIFIYFDSFIPSYENLYYGKERKEIEGLVKKLLYCLKVFQFNKLISNCMEFVNWSNRLIDREKPWEMYDAGRMRELASLLNVLANGVKILFFFLSPILIENKKRMFDILNVKEEQIVFSNLLDMNFLSGKKVELSGALFPKK